jgi:hypothetical protein
VTLPGPFAVGSQRAPPTLAHGLHAEALDRLRILAQAGPLTVLTATRDVEHAHTAVLVELLDNGVGQDLRP